MDKLTAINFITSIAALRVSITLPTSRDVLSIPTSELIYSSVCVQKVNLQLMNSYNSNMLTSCGADTTNKGPVLCNSICKSIPWLNWFSDYPRCVINSLQSENCYLLEWFYTAVSINSLQRNSSLPSKHWGYPSHFALAGMHCPLEHLNWFDVQSVCMR